MFSYALNKKLNFHACLAIAGFICAFVGLFSVYNLIVISKTFYFCHFFGRSFTYNYSKTSINLRIIREVLHNLVTDEITAM